MKQKALTPEHLSPSTTTQSKGALRLEHALCLIGKEIVIQQCSSNKSLRKIAHAFASKLIKMKPKDCFGEQTKKREKQTLESFS